MSPDRTAPTTLRHSLAQRSAAPETATADGFAALLGAVDQAAAAPARPERRDAGPQPRGRDDRPDDRAPAPADPAAPVAAPAPAAPAAPPADAPVLADPLLPIAPPAPAPAADATAIAVPPTPAAPVAEPTATAALPLAAPIPVATQAAPVAAAPAADAPTAPAAAVVEPAAPTGTEAPVAELPQAALPADVKLPDVPVDAPAEPAPAPDAPEAPAAPAAPTTQTATDANADAGTTGEQSAPREQAPAAPADKPAPAAQPTTQPAQAASAPAPVHAAGLSLAQRATPLHQAPRAVAQVIQVAQERDISHAKLNLRPVELGGIEIRLQSSSAGVTAQVIADSPEAAKLLQQAADDLRRSLERQDVTLLSLDVSTAGDGRPDGSAGASADLAGDRARHFAAFGGAPEAADTADEAPAVVETVEIADGLHVDILA
jgi:hypothetical protein